VSSAVSILANKAGFTISVGSKHSAKYTGFCPFDFDVMLLRFSKLSSLQAYVVTCQLNNAL
jgi:hypothetical protein